MKPVPLMAALALAAYLAFAATTASADEWTRADTTWQAAATALQAVDCSYSLDMPSRYPELFETNPLLGRHPSKRSIRAWCAGAIVLHPVVSRVLPPPWRRYWQILTIGVEASTVMAQISVGLRMTW